MKETLQANQSQTKNLSAFFQKHFVGDCFDGFILLWRYREDAVDNKICVHLASNSRTFHIY